MIWYTLFSHKNSVFLNKYQKMLSNLINLCYLNFIKALLKDGYCLKRATLIFHPIFSKWMKNLQLLKKSRIPKLKKMILESRNIFYLVYTFVYIANGTTPDAFVFLIHIILSGTKCAHFQRNIAYFGKRHLSSIFFPLKDLIKRKITNIG